MIIFESVWLAALFIFWGCGALVEICTKGKSRGLAFASDASLALGVLYIIFIYNNTTRLIGKLLLY